MEEERRGGMVEVAEKLGYIAGKVDGLHSKLDTVVIDVKENTGKIAAVDKRLNKWRNIGIGVVVPFSTFWAYVVVKWDQVQSFFQGHP